MISPVLVAALVLATAVGVRGQDQEPYATCGEWQMLTNGNFSATGVPPTVKMVNGSTVFEVESVQLTTVDGQPLPFSSAAMVAHVHAAPCAEGNGGPHWQRTVDGGADFKNEVWAVLANVSETMDFSGTGFNKLGVNDLIKSVVIHSSLDNQRMTCCDLSLNTAMAPAPTAVEYSGQRVANCGDWQSLDGNHTASGTAPEVDVLGNGTVTIVDEFVLTAAGAPVMFPPFVAHIHNDSCATQQGGPHWQLEGPNGAVTPYNEVWLGIAAVDGGQFQGSTYSPFLINDQAKSIVVHSPVDGSRMVCCDLQLVQGVPNITNLLNPAPPGALAPGAAPSAGSAAAMYALGALGAVLFAAIV